MKPYNINIPIFFPLTRHLALIAKGDFLVSPLSKRGAGGDFINLSKSP